MRSSVSWKSSYRVSFGECAQRASARRGGQGESSEGQTGCCDHPLPAVEHISHGRGSPDWSAKLEFPDLFSALCIEGVEVAVIIACEQQSGCGGQEAAREVVGDRRRIRAVAMLPTTLPRSGVDGAQGAELLESLHETPAAA